MTRNFRVVLGITALAVMAFYAPRLRGSDGKTFKGEITDTQCALNIHSVSQSHKEMMAMRPEIKSEADCARFCVKEMGGRFVLLVKEKVYKLDAQAQAEAWSGQKVKVTGILDAKTNTITVQNIEPLAASPNGTPR